jgi:hypothetical protein
VAVRRLAWHPCQSAAGRPFIVRSRSSEIAPSREKRVSKRAGFELPATIAAFSVSRTKVRIRRAKAGDKRTKLADGNGLYLEVRPRWPITAARMPARSSVLASNIRTVRRAAPNHPNRRRSTRCARRLAPAGRVLNGHCLDVKFAEHATNFGWSFKPTASIRSTIAIPDHAGR